MWLILAISSAFFLGFYDVTKKISLNGNAVLPVLLGSSIAGALIFIFPFGLSRANILETSSLFFVPNIGLSAHFLILIKTVIVLSSWILAYFALKNLPITIVAPIRATSPLWTLIGAIVIFSEQLSVLQWVGVLVTFLAFYGFSTTGKLEGITLRNNKYFWFIIFATLIGAASGLYDKFLLQSVDRMAVQTFFTFYQVLLMAPVVAFLWWPKRRQYTPFNFRISILLIGLFLAIADFLYFYALSYPGSLISVISVVRRSSVIIAFGLGAVIFKEANVMRKFVFLVFILIGVVVLYFG